MVRSTLGAFDCTCERGESEGHQDIEVDGTGDDVPFDDNHRQGEGRGGLPAEAYTVPLRLPATARLAENIFLDPIHSSSQTKVIRFIRHSDTNNQVPDELKKGGDEVEFRA